MTDTGHECETQWPRWKWYSKVGWVCAYPDVAFSAYQLWHLWCTAEEALR